MRNGWMLVAAALGACGGGETKRVVLIDAGAGGRGVMKPVDADRPRDSGAPDARVELNEIGGAGGAGGAGEADGGRDPEAGSGGVAGGMVDEDTGGSPPPDSQPQGGAGAGGSGGSPAPQERVLWSQEWTVEIHEPTAYGAVAGTKMALILDAGQLCRFGLMAADSGTSQEYETDGKCITADSSPTGGPVFYAPDGTSSSGNRIAPLVGWKEAVKDRTVLRLRRTQTYETQVLGSGADAWNYADFTGKWEAIGR